MNTQLFSCLCVRLFAVMLAMSGIADIGETVHAHLRSQLVAMQQEMFAMAEKMNADLKVFQREQSQRDASPISPSSEQSKPAETETPATRQGTTSTAASLETFNQINARTYGARLYGIIALSSSGFLIGLLLFCWPAKAARSVAHGLSESLDATAVTRCVLRLFGMYFVLSTFLAFMAVTLTTPQIPLLQHDLKLLLPAGIPFIFGVAIILGERFLARVVLWKLS